MKLVTYIDGHAQTPLGQMLARHSVSCSVSVKKADREEFMRVLRERLGEEPRTPDYKMVDDPVPTTFSTDELSDLVSDCEGEPWMLPYEEELRYMAEEDPCGMGTVYLMGNRA